VDTTVVKVGGSLATYPEKLRALCAKLNEIFVKHKLMVVPGGGEFADLVRDFDKRYKLSRETSNRMAILSMDQYGFLLSSLIPRASTVNQLENLQEVIDSGKLPIFLPSLLLLRKDPLENSWNVTSDSYAVYIADQLCARKVLLVTDVDGIFTHDPKKYPNAKLIKRLTSQQLFAMHKRTSVDKFLPKLLLQLQINCFVVNGLYPERVETVLDGKDTICTLIK
jgi:aspartokinase-like uncharacterized kinase